MQVNQKPLGKLNTRVAVDQPALDLDVVNADGQVINLSSVWQDKPVVLSFLRHFG